MGEIQVTSVRVERLDEIAKADCRREGFPELTAAGFVAMYCRHTSCEPATRVRRISFKILWTIDDLWTNEAAKGGAT